MLLQNGLVTIKLEPSDINRLQGTQRLRKLSMQELVSFGEKLVQANSDYLYRSLQARKTPLDKTAEFAVCCFHRNGSIIDTYKRAVEDDDMFVQMICVRLMIDTLVRIGITLWTQTRVCSNVIYKRFLEKGLLQDEEGKTLSDVLLRDRLVRERPKIEPIHEIYRMSSHAIHASAIGFASPLTEGVMKFVDTGNDAVDDKPFRTNMLSFDYELTPERDRKEVMSWFSFFAFEAISECARAIHEIPRASPRLEGFTRDEKHDVLIKAANSLIRNMPDISSDDCLWKPLEPDATYS